jgi:hypothetical protein
VRRILVASRVAVALSAAALLLSVPLGASGATAPARAVRVSAGGYNTCALLSNGAVRCWGYNQGGELGNGVDSHLHDVPVPVAGLASGVAAIAAGGSHTCALSAAGGVKCWGSNGNGQLANSTQAVRRTPLDMPGLASGVRAIAAGGDTTTNGGQTCALTSAGGVKCWGYYPGNGGPGCCSSSPVNVGDLTSGVVAIGSFGNRSPRSRRAAGSNAGAATLGASSGTVRAPTASLQSTSLG